MHLIPLLLFVLWMKPGLILTPKVVQKVFDQYASPYFSRQPGSLKLEIKSHGLLTKHFLVEATDFCLKEPEGCFKIAHAELTVKITGVPRIELREIGPIEVRNESLKIVSEEETKPKPKPSPSEPKQRVTLSKDLKIHPILIDFPDIRVHGEEEVIQAKMNLSNNGGEDFVLAAEANSNRALKAKLNAQTRFAYDRQNPLKLRATLDRVVDPPQSIEGTVDGNINWQTLRGEISGEAKLRRMVPWIQTLVIRDLKAVRQDKLHVRAGIDAHIEPDLNPEQTSVLPPAPLSQTLKGNFEADEKDGFVQYTIRFDPAKNQPIVIQAFAGGRYPFDPKGKSFFGVEKLSLRVAVPEFQRLVQSFKRTSFAIPAPFSTMKGPMEFLMGDVDKNLQGASVPLKFETNLNSAEQAIVTQTGGQIDFVPETGAVKINGETHIKQIKITMPDLKILEPIPLVTYDKRIVSRREKAREQREERDERESRTEEESRNEMSWKMTSDPGAIQIYHPILKPYAPITVNWEVGDHPRGEINLEPFVIDYLNRPAKVKRMRFYQDPKTGEFKYDGRLIVAKTDYTIFVDIFKIGEKTKVELTSSPPLSEEDIVSVLLFNDVTSSLDQDQSSSVGSTRSAIANRALGLFSILALSSTPVEAVNYNTATGVYSARVRLASGLTATVGTNWDQTQEVALRKRLGRNFVLSTVLQSPSDSSEDTQKTMLEWFRRF